MIKRGEAMTWRTVLALGVAMVMGACAPASPPDTRAQDEAAIRAADEAWSASATDIEAFMSHVAADAMFMPPNELMASGPEAIRKTYSEMLAAPNTAVSWTPTSVTVAQSGDLGYSVGTYNVSMTGPDGKPMSDHGKYLTIWKKQTDGAWKVAGDIFNSDVPMPAPDTTKK